MNLLEIILQYLEKCEFNQVEADKFLASLVKDAGMSRSLVKHIKGCHSSGKAKRLGSFLQSSPDEKLQDVNIWSVQVTS